MNVISTTRPRPETCVRAAGSPFTLKRSNLTSLSSRCTLWSTLSRLVFCAAMCSATTASLAGLIAPTASFVFCVFHPAGKSIAKSSTGCRKWPSSNTPWAGSWPTRMPSSFARNASRPRAIGLRRRARELACLRLGARDAVRGERVAVEEVERGFLAGLQREVAVQRLQETSETGRVVARARGQRLAQLVGLVLLLAAERREHEPAGEGLAAAGHEVAERRAHDAGHGDPRGR